MNTRSLLVALLTTINLGAGIDKPTKIVTHNCSVEQGKTFSIQLPANRTTGYQQQITSIDSHYLELQEQKYEQSDKQKKLMGAPGFEHFTFKAINAGKTVVLIDYKRPWEKDSAPVEQNKIQVTITAPKKSCCRAQ